MKFHRKASHQLKQGFTLLEVLVVIAIIAVLASITVGGIGFYKRKAAESKTEVFIASVSQALDEYKSDEGVYPTDGADGSEGSSSVVYEALYGDADGDGEVDDDAEAYLATLNPNSTGPALNVQESDGSYVLMDGWKNELRYRSPGDQNPDFDLWSAGADMETNLANDGDDAKDDIDNW